MKCFCGQWNEEVSLDNHPASVETSEKEEKRLKGLQDTKKFNCARKVSDDGWLAFPPFSRLAFRLRREKAAKLLKYFKSAFGCGYK